MDAHWLEHNAGATNHIQVYGLPRSGTNFVEWTLMHNFKGVVYHNTYARSDVPSIGLEVVARKHTFPSLKYSKYAIVIYKAWPAYVVSYRDWAGCDPSQVDYDKYLEAARSLDPKRCIVIAHAWAYENYTKFMCLVADTFDIHLDDNIIKPKNRLDRGGAGCTQTDVEYALPGGKND